MLHHSCYARSDFTSRLCFRTILLYSVFSSLAGFPRFSNGLYNKLSLQLVLTIANRQPGRKQLPYSVHATEILWILSLCDSVTESESSRHCFLWPHHFGGNIREIHGLVPGIKSQNSNFIQTSYLPYMYIKKVKGSEQCFAFDGNTKTLVYNV